MSCNAEVAVYRKQDILKISLHVHLFICYNSPEVISMSIKQEALQTLNELPETATWDDVIYTFYVKQKISKGIKDIKEGKTISQQEAIQRLIPDAY